MRAIRAATSMRASRLLVRRAAREKQKSAAAAGARPPAAARKRDAVTGSLSAQPRAKRSKNAAGEGAGRSASGAGHSDAEQTVGTAVKSGGWQRWRECHCRGRGAGSRSQDGSLSTAGGTGAGGNGRVRGRASDGLNGPGGTPGRVQTAGPGGAGGNQSVRGARGWGVVWGSGGRGGGRAYSNVFIGRPRRSRSWRASRVVGGVEFSSGFVYLRVMPLPGKMVIPFLMSLSSSSCVSARANLRLAPTKRRGRRPRGVPPGAKATEQGPGGSTQMPVVQQEKKIENGTCHATQRH